MTTVPSMLRECGELVREQMHRYLPEREPRAYLYDLAREYPARGGKMMRPSLCISAARAFGGSTEDALLTAASIELLHNALLVHDDIQDESAERRGRPTLHKVCGIPLAMNAGSAMTLLSLAPLLDNFKNLAPQLGVRVLSETARVAQECAEGQALELGWCKDNRTDLVVADYLRMVLKKTCWLATIHPIRAGALIGSRGRAPVDSLNAFGFMLGAAFQIQDDLLNLEGQHARYGKEMAGDLWEGKRTLILIHLLEVADEATRSEARRLLSIPRAQKTRRDVQRLHALLLEHRCTEYARTCAHGLAGAARHEFERTFAHLPESRDKHFLHEVIRWVFEQN